VEPELEGGLELLRHALAAVGASEHEQDALVRRERAAACSRSE
jgi:hypothetical protein